MAKEIEIPEGYEAKIENNKVIFVPKESEDEMIRKAIGAAICGTVAISILEANGTNLSDALAYLEKQKENSKSANSIPADCVSDAKCEDRWYKTANSLPDNGRDVLAKDALGNYLLASFDGAQWFVSVYDGEDHPVLHTPPILEWCDIPSEKQKEQKPLSTEETELNSISFLEQLGYTCVPPGVEHLDIGFRDGVASVKPAEWSEEDEKTLASVIAHVEDSQCFDHFHDITKDKVFVWLKNLPYRIRPSWKPSEEQMEAVLTAQSVGSYGHRKALAELYNDLKKLM